MLKDFNDKSKALLSPAIEIPQTLIKEEKLCT